MHEYGGLSYLPVPSEVAVATLAKARKGREPDPPIVFTHFSDQRMYLAGQAVADGSGQPVPLTPEPPASEPLGLRYADFVLSPDGPKSGACANGTRPGKVHRAISRRAARRLGRDRRRRGPRAGHRL